MKAILPPSSLQTLKNLRRKLRNGLKNMPVKFVHIKKKLIGFLEKEEKRH